MKLIVTGSTGILGREVVRQSLQKPEITSVVALARKPVKVDGIDNSKLKSVVISDYGEYPDHVKAEFAGADACIWTVGITPMKSKGYDFAEVKRVCQDCTLAGLNAMYEAGTAKPFRFLYLSGDTVVRDQTQKSLFLGEYLLIRGEAENKVVAFGAAHDGVEVCVARPGLIMSSDTFWRAAQAHVFGFTNMFTRAIVNITRTELTAALLDQVVQGFEKDPLTNADLLRLGQQALKESSASKTV